MKHLWKREKLQTTKCVSMWVKSKVSQFYQRMCATGTVNTTLLFYVRWCSFSALNTHRWFSCYHANVLIECAEHYEKTPKNVLNVVILWPRKVYLNMDTYKYHKKCFSWMSFKCRLLMMKERGWIKERNLYNTKRLKKTKKQQQPWKYRGNSHHELAFRSRADSILEGK